jgi:hypothetical protein
MEMGWLVWVIMAALGLFGVVYDRATAWMEGLGSDHGYVAFLVVGGVAVTLVGIGLADLVLDWNAGLIGLLLFACSGLPMIIGSMRRHLGKLKAQQDEVRMLMRRLDD